MQIQYPESSDSVSQATLPRRLAAIFYDSLLCIALMFVVTGLYMMISNVILGGETYKQMNDAGETINDPLLTAAIFLSLFAFFGFFWTKTGQTLGMQVWHIRVQTPDGCSITWKQALIRMIGAFISISCFGAGYLWAFIDDNKKSFHCHLSGTTVVRIPKRERKN